MKKDLRNEFLEDIKKLSDGELVETFNYYYVREQHLGREEKLYLELLTQEVRDRGLR